MRLGRRALLGGLVASLAAPRHALAATGLGGQISYIVQDLHSGETLDARNPALALPPASIVKTLTAAYALDHLGDQHRYRTQLLAQGPISAGVLEGDLILAGGGDPTLSSDDLADLAAQLAALGLRAISGDFLLWDGALPQIAQIDASQDAQLGYNPSIAGLNLNYNRLHLGWTTDAAGLSLTLDARAVQHAPPVTSTIITLADRQTPLFRHQPQGDLDHWHIARSALTGAGGHWLPARNPAHYAGDVFATLARAQGLTLPAPQRSTRPAQGQVLAEKIGAPLPQIAADMLRYSTNLTAEVLGLTASGAPDLPRSAQAMAAWAQQQAEPFDGSFVDHSGLGDQARISAAAMAQVLRAPRIRSHLTPLLRQMDFTTPNHQPLTIAGAQMQAKTGTLYFVSTLAGYLRSSAGSDLVFTILTADLDARAAARTTRAPVPDGARAWGRAARALHQTLVQDWAGRIR